jgi:WD40 repeat protein
MAFSPDHSWLAVVGGSPGVSGEVRLIPWTEEFKKTTQPRVLATHDDVFFAVAFRPDGTQLASGSADGTVRMFDVATGTENPPINSHSDWVQSICFAPDGNRIATASRDKTAKVFDVPSNKLLATFSEHGASVRTVAFAPDGKSVISGGGSRLCVWNSDDAKLIGEMTGFGADIHVVVCHGNTVVAASADRTVRIFNIVDRSLVRSLSEQPTSVVSLACHRATNLGGIGCFDGTTTIVNLETGAVVRQFLAIPSGKSQ